MAQDAVVTVAAGGTWPELTDGNVTAISFQVLGNDYILVQATTSAAPTAGSVNGYHYNAQMGAQNVSLTDLWPGVASADRVFARTETGNPCDVKVSHA